MAETTYTLGEIARLTAEFKVSNVDTDATTVVITVKKPDGDTLISPGDLTVVHSGTGLYHCDLTVDQAGWWSFKYVGTGTAADTAQGTFYVIDDLTTSQTVYATLDQVKNALAAAGTSFADIDIQNAINSASRAIDEACDRRFYLTDETRVYSPTLTNRPWGFTDSTLEIDDLTTLTLLKVDLDGDGTYETTWTNGTQFYLDPPNAALDSKPFERVVLRPQNGACFPAYPNTVQVEGSFGWPSVPSEVNQYCVIFATQLMLRTRQAPFGVLMAGMEIGAVTRISRFDPDFDRLLGHLVKPNRLIA